MHEYKVEDMTCGHCAGTVEKAIKATDPAAKVEVDLSNHTVRIESAQPSEAFKRVIENAGYSPEPK
ncbi:heavy-metal-associated domain-containing protein [Pelagibacterium sp. 26DY04]|uniref:heavy-metal-associated domain-containing protein n=1 Tax=Pelagibacterium sp. 26DY04 TaxID=2967130 RepID=UPI00281649EF|nr:heavy-metal-associated domain-containing protein [Pelagibacterium sp. 26DY04]WMT86528.1 heavy-metal-associated domain-containing protein [Pelagibacterium sp. 26DY04]